MNEFAPADVFAATTSTAKMAARLEAQSTGGDVVISSAVYSDPEVRDLLSDPDEGFSATRFEIPLKGFDEEQFELWRVTRVRTWALRTPEG